MTPGGGGTRREVLGASIVSGVNIAVTISVRLLSILVGFAGVENARF